ncbi:MAG: type II toxin-antitoxin system Phd/YefM family antitoxin [Actinomycetota bacterium]
MSKPDRTIPPRELRNHIGKVLREVEEESRTIRVTVDGRPVADLVPVSHRRTSVPWSELMRIIDETPVDAGFAEDARIDERIADDDPWEPGC